MALQEPRPQGTRRASILVREWRERIGSGNGYPSEELPRLVRALEDAGYTITTEYDGDGRRLELRYLSPDDVEAPERDIELIVTALLATKDSDSWCARGVRGVDVERGVTWYLGHWGLARWSPFGTVEKAVSSLTEVGLTA